MWLNEVYHFREIIQQCISQPPTEAELNIEPTLNEDELLEILLDSFRVFGFIDCADFRTT
jgi:hypothetical protein